MTNDQLDEVRPKVKTVSTFGVGQKREKKRREDGVKERNKTVPVVIIGVTVQIIWKDMSTMGR